MWSKTHRTRHGRRCGRPCAKNASIARQDAETCKPDRPFRRGASPDRANVIHPPQRRRAGDDGYGTGAGRDPRRLARWAKQLHVFVDETRPRLQGAPDRLGAEEEDIPHQVIADGASGHFLRRVGVQMSSSGRTA
ncbi:MAG: hypothetical protein IPK19_10010 [Chloroflexi bacterium]|nr:hypothetical protein [Chloroflexota bacterium]